VRKGIHNEEDVSRSNIAFATVWTVNIPDSETGVITGWDKRDGVIKVLQVAIHSFSFIFIHFHSFSFIFIHFHSFSFIFIFVSAVEPFFMA